MDLLERMEKARTRIVQCAAANLKAASEVAHKQITTANDRVAFIGKLEEELGNGQKFIDKWGWCYGPFNVTKADLPKVRQLVGRVRKTDTDVPDDFDETGEVIVTIAPVENPHNVSFTYRTKFRRGGKCRVHTTTNSYTTRTLVCDR